MPDLRIAGYVANHAEHTAAEQQNLGRHVDGVQLPNIKDYWPDTPNRPGSTRPPGTSTHQPPWAAYLPSIADHPRTAGTFSDEHGDHWWGWRPVLLVGGLALVVATGTVLILRPVSITDLQPDAAAVLPVESAGTTEAAPVSTAPVSVAPTPTTASPSPSITPTTANAQPDLKQARFELVTGVTELSVRFADIGDDVFRVDAPDDAGVEAGSSLVDGVLKVGANYTGAGSGRVNVLLSNRITWELRMREGVKLAQFQLTSGNVDSIDLDGGAETINIGLGKITTTLPIRMDGGVSQWTISTAQKLPVRVLAGSGGGDVVLYGTHSGGVGAGTLTRSGDVDKNPGLDIDATGGFGTLTVKQS
ncbi:hypothetical protein [Actinoplanes sp. NPDC051851]|uniref:hypothetical protein n=1 Tax=Actinoplanes sp. NPDC051851 TaxID=3154753 RepID=UPI003415593D